MPFEVAVANAFGAGSQRFTVLAAAPPVITSAAARVGATCVRYRYDADETPDVAGSAPLAWSLRVGPQGMSLDPKTGRVRWVPTHPGQFSACLEVVNAVGAAEECFEVSVPGDGDAGEESGECGPHEPLTVGCGCASASTGASFALLLAGVGWLLERRRRGRQVHADGGG